MTRFETWLEAKLQMLVDFTNEHFTILFLVLLILSIVAMIFAAWRNILLWN